MVTGQRVGTSSTRGVSRFEGPSKGSNSWRSKANASWEIVPAHFGPHRNWIWKILKGWWYFWGNWRRHFACLAQGPIYLFGLISDHAGSFGASSLEWCADFATDPPGRRLRSAPIGQPPWPPWPRRRRRLGSQTREDVRGVTWKMSGLRPPAPTKGCLLEALRCTKTTYKHTLVIFGGSFFLAWTAMVSTQSLGFASFLLLCTLGKTSYRTFYPNITSQTSIPSSSGRKVCLSATSFLESRRNFILYILQQRQVAWSR